MVEIPKFPAEWVEITRTELADPLLGGSLTTAPNLALSQIAQCLGHLEQRLSAIEGKPFVADPISNYGAIELDTASTFNLDSVFTDPNSDPLTYTVENNSDPTRVNASITSNVLTVSYLEWTSDTDPIDVSIRIRATNTGTQFAEDTFVVTVNPLETLFTENYYVFDNTSEPESADIYVNATERNIILADPTLSAKFNLSNGGVPVFRAIPNGATIPAAAISGGQIIEVFRFRFNTVDGSYLYATEPEATTIRANPDFTEEGTAFFAFATTESRGSEFTRYAYTATNPDGDYIYTVGSAIPGVPPSSYTLEGDVCRINLI